MPSCIPSNRKQLTTFEANQSRFVTKCRWPVEVVNGLLKTLFRAHNKVVSNVTLHHSLSDFRIAGALINRFHKRLISDPDNGIEIAREMLSKLNTINELENIVDTYRIDRNRKSYKKLNANMVSDFPKLDLETIKKKITLETYQLKQSLNYLAEHQRENGNFTIEIYDNKEKILNSNRSLLRARFQFRHTGNTKYNSYITYWPNENSVDKIDGWLCTCKCGKRTVGCCSHCASLIYYLSYGRHKGLTNPAASLESIFPTPVLIESSDDEDAIINNVNDISSDETEIRSDAIEISSNETEIRSDAIFSSDETEERDPQQYVPIYPDLSELMESL